MTESWDVIVVGAGSAGIPAAIKAAERGAKVLQLEADEKIGGTLFLSSGQISAAGTKRQKNLGIIDSAEEHYADAQRIAEGTIDPVLGRLAIDHAGTTYDWLESLGYKPINNHPVTAGAHEPYLTRRYHWAETAAIHILDVLRPVHTDLVDKGSINLQLNTRMTKLLADSSGAVSGVEVATQTGSKQYMGRNIVLTTGGYSHNADMWQEITPNIPLRAWTNAFSQGDGIRAAKELGAHVDGEEKFLCTFAGVLEDPNDPFSTSLGMQFAPQVREPWEIYINTAGRRFVREDHPSVHAREHALLRQDGQRFFIILDEGIRQNAPPINPMMGDKISEKFGKHPHYSKAATLDELANKIKVPVDNLNVTIQNFNEAIETGVDTEFGRLRMFRKIEKPPFYAIHAGGITVVSPAGLNANKKLEVLKADGSPIPNLYAAGEVLGFTRLSGSAFVNGMSLMPALTFGCLLGEEILRWRNS